jgi:hypothetical protein
MNAEKEPDTLSMEMSKALRYIKHGAVPSVIIHGGAGTGYDSESDVEGVAAHDDDVVDCMSDIVIVRNDAEPPVLSGSNGVASNIVMVHAKPVDGFGGDTEASLNGILAKLSSEEGVAPPTPHPTPTVPRTHRTTASIVNLSSIRDVIAVIPTVTKDMASAYHAQAMAAEVEFRKHADAEVHTRCLQLTKETSQHIETAVMKYKKRYEWLLTDVRAQRAAREGVYAKRVAGVRAKMQAQESEDMTGIRRYVMAWKGVVREYKRALVDSSSVLTTLLESGDAQVKKESIHVARTLVAVSIEVLDESVARVQDAASTEDAFQTILVLRHAIEDSATDMKRICKTCVGVRPAYEDARYGELQDALRKTQEDVNYCVEQMRTRPQDESTQKRLASNRQMQLFMEKELQDAQVQRVVCGLADVCAKQAEWDTNSRHLASLSSKKYAALQASRAKLQRAEAVEKIVYDTNITDFALSEQAQRLQLRQELNADVQQLLQVVADAKLCPGPYQRYFLARVLLQHATL